MGAPLCTFLLGWIPGTATWITIWTILAAATVLLVVLVRTRWSEARPWKKCALLSLWVHVLLACLAIYIRFESGGGPGIGPGEGGPIRVGVISADAGQLAAVPELPMVSAGPVAEKTTLASGEQEPAVEEPAAKTDEEPAPAPDLIADAHDPPKPTPSPETNAVAAAPSLPKPDASLAPPDLLAPPEPAPGPPTPDKAVVVAATPDDGHPAAAPSETKVATNDSPPSPARAVASGDAGASPTASSKGASASDRGVARSGVPAAYAARFGDRTSLVAGGGGNPRTEKAVQSALAWLAAAQSQDGHWDPKKFGAGQERYVLGENRGGVGARADTGISALALLAMLGSGNTHLQGAYAENVARGLDYLRRTQGANGNLGGNAELFAHTYCHSMATFAVSEAYALTGDPKLRPIVERAVAYSLSAQHPTDGGWRYRSGDTGDTSQLGWQLMALRSAELGGVPIPAVTWTRVERFLRNVERGADGGLAAYRPEGAPSRAMTAEALFCRQLITHRADGGLAPAALDEARRAMLQEQPGGVTVNLYYWYYATIALHRGQHHSTASDEAWDEWNDALTRTLVSSQSSDGSWSTACIWGGYGGKVYTTALAAMCLEVYYRYAPDDETAPAATSPAPVAHRESWQTVPTR